MERSFIIVKYCCSQRNATKLATTSPTCKGQTLAGGGSKVMDAWQRKALGAELFNLLRVFDALGPIAVHSRDSRRRLELRRRSGVRSHSIYESSRHFDSRPLGAESSWAVQGCTPLITPTHIQRPTGGSARFSASNQTGAVKNIVAIPRSPRCSVCFSDLFADRTVRPRVTSLGMQRLIAQTEPCFASDAIDRPHFFSASDGVASNAFLFSGVYRRVVVMSLARWPSCRRQF
jgi:hypothetical protein